MGVPDLKWLYLGSVTPNKKLLNSNVTKHRKTIDNFWRESYCDIIIFAEGPTGKTIMNGAHALLKKLLKSNMTKPCTKQKTHLKKELPWYHHRCRGYNGEYYNNT